jgi:hypothetical protein
MTLASDPSSRLADLARLGEDHAAMSTLLAHLIAVYTPQDGLEQALVERLAVALWKEGRGERLEARALGAEGGPDRALLALALRYQAAAQTSARRALDMLLKHRKAKRQGLLGAPAAPLPETLPAVVYEPVDDDAAANDDAPHDAAVKDESPVPPLPARLVRLLDRQAPKAMDDLDLADAVCALLVPDWPPYRGALEPTALKAALTGLTLAPRDLDWLAGHELARACRSGGW